MTESIVYPANATTLILRERAYNDLAEGDVLTLTPVNPKTSRNNSQSAVTIANRSDGDVHDLEIVVLKGGDDDVHLNSQMNQANPVVFAGSMKTNFVKDGVDGVDSWDLQGGSLTDRPTDGKNTTEGNATMVYKIQFRVAKRNL